MVHNHGPYEGDGLDCREYRQPDGSLIGQCLQIEQAWREHVATRPLTGSLLWPPAGDVASFSESRQSPRFPTAPFARVADPES